MEWSASHLDYKKLFFSLVLFPARFNLKEYFMNQYQKTQWSQSPTVTFKHSIKLVLALKFNCHRSFFVMPIGKCNA